MYVIGRAVHEQIQIGSSITIRVLKVGDKHVTLGIDAPRAMPLPRQQNACSACPEPDRAAAAELSILIVDDTPIHAWLIQKAFAAYGTGQTQVARSGQDALARLGLAGERVGPPSRFDLILMECRCPDMPGLELLRRIRSCQRLKTVPVIVMSYQDSDVEVSRFLQSGANAFVPKPETQEGFRQTVFRIASFWSHARRALPPEPAMAAAESLVC